VADKGWDFFSREEVGKVVAVAQDDDERALLLFALGAGEQLALEWGDLDWHSKLVVIRRSSTRGEIGPTKSKRSAAVSRWGRWRCSGLATGGAGWSPRFGARLREDPPPPDVAAADRAAVGRHGFLLIARRGARA
jgi:hypothetical protein